ncbi:MAG: hypothetical protein QOF44_3882, partial [Streptomyces sp.]|nr:hypothetical protein [Streptomyces sp.]
MARRSWVAFVAAVLMVFGSVSLATAAPAAADSSNLAVNPGFETGDLSGWSCGTTTASVVTTPVHTGTHSLAATTTASDTAQCTQTITVQPGSAYTLSAYVVGSYVYLGTDGYSSTWTPSATSWQQLSTTFTTGATTTSVKIYLHGWYAQGTYRADDVSLTGPSGSGGGTVTIPAAPTGLAVSGTTSSSASLSWNASTGATGYNVYQGSAKVASVTTTAATVTGLAASTSYAFSVTATNSAGESAKSTAVTATTPSAGTGG